MKLLKDIIYRIMLWSRPPPMFYFPTNPGMIMRREVCIRCNQIFEDIPMAISVSYEGEFGSMCPNCYAHTVYGKRSEQKV